jgi:hypothetical protein
MKRLQRRIFRNAALAAVLVGSGLSTAAVHGQPAAPPAVAPAQRTLNLTAEQEYVIREIILKDENIAKEKSDTPQTIGDAVPETIALHDFPADVTAKVPQVKAHKFFVKDDLVILVSPSDRRIADVIKKKSTD